MLVVDDDEIVRQTLADLLSREGYQVATAQNGAEALVRLRGRPRFRPFLILLDSTMPVMGGREFYDHKQRDPSLMSIPIILMSADEDLRQTAAALGSAYLAKPARLDAMLELVRRFLNSAHQFSTLSVSSTTPRASSL